MKKLGYKILFLFGILLTLACTNDKIKMIDPIDLAIRSLVGEWDWVKSVAPRTRQELTPETEGYTASIKFLANDTVEYYQNGEMTDKYPYQLKYRLDDNLNLESDSTLVLVINKGAEYYFSVENDSLVLNQGYLDGPASYYTKKK